MVCKFRFPVLKQRCAQSYITVLPLSSSMDLICSKVILFFEEPLLESYVLLYETAMCLTLRFCIKSLNATGALDVQ